MGKLNVNTKTNVKKQSFFNGNNNNELKHSSVSVNLKEDIESLKKIFNDKFYETGQTFKMTANIDDQN